MVEENNWLLRDKHWVSRRKTEWKGVNKKLKEFTYLTKEQKLALKRYFLSGDFGKELPHLTFFEAILAPDVNKAYPINEIQGYILFVLWFHPDRSEEHWELLRESISCDDWLAGASLFREKNSDLSYHYPNGESFFDGLEFRLMKFFRLDRLKRDDFAQMDDGRYSIQLERALSVARTFVAYLMKENPSPYDITRWRVDYWRDAMLQGYKEFVGFDHLIKEVDATLENPERRHEFAVELALQLLDVLNDSQLPQAAKDYIANVRAGKRRKKVFPKRLP